MNQMGGGLEFPRSYLNKLNRNYIRRSHMTYTIHDEICVYKMSLPYMQEAKSKALSAQMNDHGPLHAQRVRMYAKMLCSIYPVSEIEESLLLAAALLHDIGMAKNDRARHHIISKNIVIQCTKDGELPFSKEESQVVGLLCMWHRKKYNPNFIHKATRVRVGFLASLLRLADGMDIDYRRSINFHEDREEIITKLNKDQLPHHRSVSSIAAIRICLTKIDTKAEIFFQEFEHAGLQIARFVDELVGINFSWPIQISPIHQSLPALHCVDPQFRAVVFAYCNAHGIVSAAISKKQLESQGFSVDIVCNSDLTSSPDKFWEKTFPEFDLSLYKMVSFLDLHISEKHTDTAILKIRETPGCSWTYASPLTISNREIMKLTREGVSIFLCDERALFVGSCVDKQMMFWMKVAALCNFDNPLIVSGATKDHDRTARGLRHVMRVAQGDKSITHNDIAFQIESNNSKFFIDMFDDYRRELRATPLEYKRIGRVLLMKTTEIYGRHIYDYIYQAIEGEGVRRYDDNEFEAPFAIYPQFKQNGLVRVLFLSNFIKDENAFPIKYFISHRETSIGASSTIWQTFDSHDEALNAINGVISEINRHYGVNEMDTATLIDISQASDEPKTQ